MLVAGVLGGCSSDIYLDRRESISLASGDAQATNRVAHMIDPWPRHVGNRDIAFNGERIQSAVERYRRHEVIRPFPESTGNLNSQRVPAPITTERISVVPPAAAAPPPGGSTIK